MSDLLHTARQFASDISEITPLGNGLINDTYRVTTKALPFVLQRINHHVFPRPEQIMSNLAVIAQHVRNKASTDVKLQVPSILPCNNGATLYQDDNQDYWRALTFIERSESIETIRTMADAEQIGFALGHFHYLLSDVNPTLLQDTLPGFHIAPEYLSNYRRIVAKTAVKSDSYCASFIEQFQALTDDLETAKQQGLLHLRVIHGDPKINNFLFDQSTQNIISLIDLDTVKPGLVHYDIGDCLRSCCHNLDNHSFDLDIADAILKNYLAETRQFFSDYDYQFLYPAIRLIPFELGIRFYADYLDGNGYFKVTEPDQNLHRAIDQFRLCANIMANESAIKKLITQSKKGL